MNLIDKANETLKSSNPRRYKFHLTANSGWSNDPNGLVYFKKKYHVFLQNNPFAQNTEQIFWSHFVSSDLIKWKQVKFALAPDQKYDADGCFSGSAIVIGKKLILVYTGHKKTTDSYVESVCLAESEDGINFNKITSNPIIYPDLEINTKRFRDPKVFFQSGYYYILIGGESCQQKGQMLLYKSADIYRNWEYVGKVQNETTSLGNMIECPDYFDIAGKKIIIGSPKGMKTKVKHGFDSLYYLNQFNCDSKKLSRGEKIDDGWDFYAPQTMYDPVNEERILIGWFGLPGEQEKEAKFHFNSIGALTMPRKLTAKKGKLIAEPFSKRLALRHGLTKKVERMDRYAAQSEFVFSGISDSFFLKLFSNNAEFSLRFKDSILTVKVVDMIRQHIIEIASLKEINTLDLFIDNGLIELFINNGEKVLSNKCEFRAETVKIDFDWSGKVIGLNYDLKSIYM